MNNRIAIYTAISGAYDTLIQPFEPAEGFDFICFVPQGKTDNEQIGYWKIKEIPVGFTDNTIAARFPKLNPEIVLNDYDWSLWIDGNIAIKDPSIYQICRQLQNNEIHYAGIKHPFRDCTYDEALVVLKNGRENLKNVFHAIRFIRSKGLKRHAGLQETGIIFRKHSDKDIQAFDRLWWECLINHSAGHRDQLMHSYCMQSINSIVSFPLLPGGKDARSYPGVEYVKHTGQKKVSEKPWIIKKIGYFITDFKIGLLKFYILLFVK